MRELMRPSLAARTTLRLGGTAIAELVLEKMEDFAMLQPALNRLGGEAFVLGRGSNILARGGDLPLVLVRPALGGKPCILGTKKGKVLVKTGCATSLPSLLGFCLRHELSGLEGLCGIPASVGGAVAMNAGSFGSEVGEHLLEITIWNGNRLQKVQKDQLIPSYRNMEIAGASKGWIVLEAIFGLTRRPKGGIFEAMHLNFFEKKSRQPVTAKTAGCVFKNPARDISAGKLLDQAGFRGKQAGGVAFSEKHANFLVNEGGGTSDAALMLIEEARETVRHKFGFLLDLEVKIVPCHLP